jgi:hypothetical protein
LTSAVQSRVTLPERLTALALLGLAFLLRIPYVFLYRFNSDEPQHLHVVWGWTHGLVQYRDLFDNHAPLFHLAMAPLLALAGERAETLFVMRLSMLPVWLAALALTFTIARRLYDKRVALWAAVLLSVHFGFFFPSLEFRTDVLWAVVWLASLAVLAGGPVTFGRALGVGMLLGVSLGISQKTVLLVGSLAAATALTLALTPGTRRQLSGRRVAVQAAAAAAGFVVAPLLLSASFWAAGALGPLWHDTVQHNLLAGMGRRLSVVRTLLFPAGLCLVLLLARPMARSADGDRVRSLRLVLALTAAIYYLFLLCFWPFITAQNWLPVDPLIAVLAVAGLGAWAKRRGDATAPATVLAALLVAELAVVIFRGPVWKNRAAPQVSLVRETLSLTDPSDCVIDQKGETVFRRRASAWVLESVTMERVHRGLIPDTLPEDAVAARCCVATVQDDRFTPRARAFLERNFVRVGQLRVAGTLLGKPTGDLRPLAFTVAVPAQYAVVSESGEVGGKLDGSPYRGPRELAAGAHEFVPETPTGPLATVWAPAAAKGFSPFPPRSVAR